MREIKFRAWEKLRKEIITVHNINFKNKMINTENAWRLFDEVELMQYTGLKDKNGVEIYEGDIVRYWGGESHQGYWEYSGQGIIEYHPASFFIFENGGLSGGLEHADFIEVIGNIYENPIKE